MIKHIRRWNIWRKKCMNGKIHKLLVLVGLRWSPTFAMELLPEEVNKFGNTFFRRVHDGGAE